MLALGATTQFLDTVSDPLVAFMASWQCFITSLLCKLLVATRNVFVTYSFRSTSHVIIAKVFRLSSYKARYEQTVGLLFSSSLAGST